MFSAERPPALPATKLALANISMPASFNVVSLHAYLNREARRSSAAGRASRAWYLQWLSNLRSSLGTDEGLRFLAAIAAVAWINVTADEPSYSRSGILNHMVRMNNVIVKHPASFANANARQRYETVIHMLPTKAMQRLAVDSRPAHAAPASAALPAPPFNGTCTHMFKRLAENPALAERAGPPLVGMHKSRKKAKKPAGAEPDPELRLRLLGVFE